MGIEEEILQAECAANGLPATPEVVLWVDHSPEDREILNKMLAAKAAELAAAR